MKKLFFLLPLLISFLVADSYAQMIENNPSNPPGFGSDTSVFYQQGGAALKDFYAKKDTVAKHYAASIKYVDFYQFDNPTLSYQKLDTSIVGYQNYWPSYFSNQYYEYLGNTGLAVRNMYGSLTQSMGFNDGLNSFDLYKFNPDSVQFYKLYAPYSEISWISGMGKESLVDIIHTQNVKPNLNIGARYYSSGSTGDYARQRAKDNMGAFWLWYQAPNLRYNLATSLVTNNLKTPENGGLPNDSLFKSNVPKSDHKYEQVYLNNALNTIHDNTISLKQSYILGIRDSNATKSEEAFGTVYSKLSNTIIYSNRYNQFDYIYTPLGVNGSGDPLPADEYFSNVFYNQNQASDRITQDRFRTDIDLTLIGVKKNNQAYIGGGIAYENITYKQSSINANDIRFQTYRQDINNMFLKADVGLNLSSNVRLYADGYLGIMGYNLGDIALNGKFGWNISEQIGVLYTGIDIQNIEPAMIYQNYSSNFHHWSHKLEKVNTNRIWMNYSNPKTRSSIGLEYNLINNYTYFAEIGKQVLPQQYNDVMSVFRGTFEQKIPFGRFTWDSYYCIQGTNTPEILAAPTFYTYQSVYYMNKAIKSIVEYTIGIDMRYYTNYTAMGYAPELASFYILEKGAMEVGNYPIFDVYLTAALKRTRFIMRYSYFNQGITRDGYYTVTHYPMHDSSFQFCVAWRFYD